jgi:putative intracellular protease/amidase
MRSIMTTVIAVFVLAAVFSASAVKGQEARIMAGVYMGDGASMACVVETYEALRIDPAIVPSLVSPTDIYTGGLDGLDVLIFPGGSGSKENLSMGSGSHTMVREFVVEKGKGVVGICAGGYLVSSSEGYPCLGLIEVGTVDREHDVRGSAVCRVSFTKKGLEIFPEMEGLEYGYIQYHDGPVFVPPSDSGYDACDELAVNESDVHQTGPAGITPGKSFLLCQEAGKGRVFACAGHPESTVGMRWMVPRMVRWVARRDIVPYPPNVVRPGYGTVEIMHSDEHETDLFWKLFDPEPQARMNAVSELMKGRYRNGFRWAAGMIRDESPEVRAFAAEILAGAEYTASIDDIEAVIDEEKDNACRMRLQKALAELKAMVAD